MTKLRSFLYLLIIFLTISSLSYGEENPKKWYTGIIQPTALELQQAGDSLHIQILYNFDNIQVSSNHSIELIPVLIIFLIESLLVIIIDLNKIQML